MRASVLIILSAALTLIARTISAQTPAELAGNWVCKAEEAFTASEGEGTLRSVVRYRLSLTDVAADNTWLSGLYNAIATGDSYEAQAVGGVKLRVRDQKYDLRFERPDRVMSCRGDEIDCRRPAMLFYSSWSNDSGTEADYTYSGSFSVFPNRMSGTEETQSSDGSKKARLSCDRTQGSSGS